MSGLPSQFHHYNLRSGTLFLLTTGADGRAEETILSHSRVLAFQAFLDTCELARDEDASIATIRLMKRNNSDKPPVIVEMSWDRSRPTVIRNEAKRRRNGLGNFDSNF